MHKKLVTLIIVFNFATEMVGNEKTFLKPFYTMKRNCYTLLRAVAFSLVGGGIVFSSCVLENGPKPDADPDEVVVSLSGVVADVSSAVVKLDTKNITDYAYVIASESEDANEDGQTDPVVIFATGVSGKVADGVNEVKVKGLEGEQTYKLIFAFKTVKEEFYSTTLEVEITTLPYTEGQTFTLLETYMDGLKFHIQVPQEVLDRGNAIRYSVGTLPMYLQNKSGWRQMLDTDLLLYNGQRFVKDNTTLVYNNATIYETDENGNPIIDELTGEKVMLHTPFSPGEPVVVMGGEFAWDDTDSQGWGFDGYFQTTFDVDGYYDNMGGGGWGPLSIDTDDESDEDAYWKGEFFRKYVVINQPAALDCNVEITANVGAMSGTIDIVPDDNVYQFCYLILPKAEFDEYVMPFIDNNENYLQWFVTSYFATISFGASFGQGPTSIVLEDMLYLEPETEYELLLTAMGNEEGTTQKFFRKTFSTTAKSLPAPKVEVKAIHNPEGEDSPYEIWYNVKCTSGDAVSAKYACNYEREWTAMLNYGNTYESLVSMGNAFSAAEIAEINSEDGYNVRFSTLPGQTSLIGVLCFNEEQTSNAISTDDDPALARATSIKEPAKTPAPGYSQALSDLSGDWTLSSTAEVSNDDGSTTVIPVKTKVNISAGYSYPDILPESVYETYANATGDSREEVDALYKEFKQEVDEFNAWLKSQNRILCHGFGFDDPNDFMQYFTPRTPFELFCSDSYNGADTNSMLWDCGPKWYLQVNDEGGLEVPINSQRQYPMCLATYYTLYPIALSEAGFADCGAYGEDLIFPVISDDDLSQLTIGPAVVQDVEGNEITFTTIASAYFINGYAYPCGYQPVSALKLNKGWTEEEVPAVSSVAAKAQKVQPYGNSYGKSVTPVKRKTPIRAPKKVEFKEVKYKILTADEIKANIQKEYEAHRR